MSTNGVSGQTKSLAPTAGAAEGGNTTTTNNNVPLPPPQTPAAAAAAAGAPAPGVLPTSPSGVAPALPALPPVKDVLAQPPTPVMTWRSPKNAFLTVIKAGMAKGEMPLINIFIMSFASGIFVGYGALGAFTLYGGMNNGAGSLGALSPGLAKFLGGAIFPVALYMIVLTGGELFTGNTMYLPAALLAKRTTWPKAMRSFITSYFGNFAGCACHAYFLTYLCHEFEAEPWHSFIQSVTVTKLSYGWGVVVLRAIGANMLVCIAIFMAIASDSFEGKISACWWPIMTFFLVGYEHCVANMWTVLVGLFYGADKTFGEFIAYNLIPATIGNALGASIFAATMYFVYRDHTEQAVRMLRLHQGKHRQNQSWSFFGHHFGHHAAADVTSTATVVQAPEVQKEARV